MKNKKAFIINPKFLIIIAVALIVYFGFFYSASFLTPESYDSASASLVAEDSTSATYALSFTSHPRPSPSSCQEEVSTPININIDILNYQELNNFPDLPEGLVLDKEFKATSVNLEGIVGTAGTCSDRTRDVAINKNLADSNCKIQEYSGKARVICNFVGDITAQETGLGVAVFGLSGGYIVVKIPKIAESTSSTSESATGSESTTSEQNYKQPSWLDNVAMWFQNLINEILSIFK